MSNQLLEHQQEALEVVTFLLFYKEIKFICTFFERNISTLKSLETCLCASLNTITIQCILQKLHTKKSCSLNCERTVFTKTGSLQHYVRLKSNSRAVYTNLREQGILEQCQEQNKCVFWHMLSVSVTGGA